MKIKHQSPRVCHASLDSKGLGGVYPLPDYAWFCLCISLCILGCVIMIAADGQKYFTLRLQRGLITDGLYATSATPTTLAR
jgi:hypothetical protein